MDKDILNEMFLEMIQDIYDAELQIIDALPLMIEATAYDDLKMAFQKHLKETKQQAMRLEKIFNLLGQSPNRKTCHGLKGLVEEGQEVIEKKDISPALKDACLIVGAQKIEHYEIATYGALCALVKHLANALPNSKRNFQEILNLLNATLVEEKNTDKKLTELAEGTRIMEGINEEAEKEIVSCCE